MKRILLVTTVVAVVAVFVANYMIKNEIRSELDRVQAAASAFGTLTYDDVSVTPSGNAWVERIRFSPRGSDEAFRVDWIGLKTDSLWTLYAITHELQGGEAPNHLELAMLGIQLDLESQLMRALAKGMENQSDQMGSFSAAGCGDHSRMTFTDMVAMGYGATVSDLSMSYTLAENRNRVSIDTTLSTEGMYSITFSNELEFDPESLQQQTKGNVPPQMAAAKAANALRFRSARLSLEDHGYTSRLIEYCADEMDMEPATYREHHLNAWRSHWEKLSVEPGDEVVAAYRTYLASPGTLSVVIDPDQPIRFSEYMGQLGTSNWFDRLDPQVAVNGGEPKPLSFSLVGGTSLADLRDRIGSATAMTKLESDRPEPSTSIDQQAQTSSDPDENQGDRGGSTNDEPGAGEPVTLSIRDLPEHRNEKLTIQLQNGRTLVGEVQTIEEDRLKVRREVHGGVMVQPVDFDDIARITKR
ncbi:hypothetical protein ACMDCT_02980 [Halomonadaceae bacterium KBTZ08]